jgi:HD superfamily phosphohydrolase
MTDTIEIVRDPLWDNIRLDADALSALDTAAMQRLRYVRQLGHAFLVYPGASHSRFEHALGAFQLARRALALLAEQPLYARLPLGSAREVRLAALLHDVGHYPFSHALEEAGFPSHEALGVAKLATGPLGEALRSLGGVGLPARIGALVQGRSDNPLQGLISGSLDLDKIDYLSRDARNCGVPYGVVDVDRLLSSLTLIELPDGRIEVGVHEKGISALESLLFAKYQMYRNVYWHHAVRSATCMFKRAVRDAARAGTVTVEWVGEATDDGLMERLITAAPDGLAARLRQRRLFKRAVDMPASEVPEAAGSWIADDPDLLEQVEDALATQLGLAAGELLLDYPSRSSMLGVDLALRTRGGQAERLTDEGRAGQLGLPRIAGELYRSARRLRVFTAHPVTRPLQGVLSLAERSADEVRAALSQGATLI